MIFQIPPPILHGYVNILAARLPPPPPAPIVRAAEVAINRLDNDKTPRAARSSLFFAFLKSLHRGKLCGLDIAVNSPSLSPAGAA